MFNDLLQMSQYSQLKILLLFESRSFLMLPYLKPYLLSLGQLILPSGEFTCILNGVTGHWAGTNTMIDPPVGRPWQHHSAHSWQDKSATNVYSCTGVG